MDICVYTHAIYLGGQRVCFQVLLASKSTLTHTAKESVAYPRESADRAHVTGLMKPQVRPTRSAAEFPTNP